MLTTLDGYVNVYKIIQEMNTIELNAILYYADYLSLRTISKPVTDNCKYYFIHNTPINSAYIVDLIPFYDEDNLFYKQAKEEYIMNLRISLERLE